MISGLVLAPCAIGYADTPAGAASAASASAQPAARPAASGAPTSAIPATGAAAPLSTAAAPAQLAEPEPSPLVAAPPPATAPAALPAPAPTQPQATPAESQVGYDNGLYLRSKDKRYSLFVNGFGQLQYVLAASGQSVVSNGFYIAFGRFVASGNLFSQKLQYFIQIDGSTFGNNNNVTLLDWWMQYTFSPHFYILAGRWLVPYSRQFLTHPGKLLLPDLSAADYAFNLPRAIGLQFGGTAGRLSYDFFLTNSIRALALGTQANRNDSLSAGGRLELAILKPYGYNESVPTGMTGVQLSVGVAVAFNPVADASFFQNLEAGDDTLNLTADLGFRWERLSVQGAFYYRHLTNRSIDDSFGYYGQAGVYLVRQRLELTGRVSGALLSNRLVEAGLKNPADGSMTEYSGGLNVYLYGHGAKLQTDYSYVQLDTFSSGLAPAESIGTHRFRIQTQVLF